MTQRHNSSFSAAVCTEIDPRRHSAIRASIPTNSDMLIYRHPSDTSERYHLPSLESSAPTVQTFTYRPEFNGAEYLGEILPSVDDSQYAYYPQNDHFRNYSDLSNQGRLSLQVNPFTSSMDPFLLYSPGNYSSHLRTQLPQSAYSTTMTTEMLTTAAAPAINSGLMSFKSLHDEYYTEPSWQQGLPVFYPHKYNQPASTDDGMDGTDGLDSLEEDESNNFDKPYAQLIHEALLQAPGHRMLLRDIYDWFITNTRKPRESGTNGWQNSIRHNLSMNQAFENDKNDPTISRGTKKANSMWVLTEHAIKHGVQSTTRYRKNATSKKGSSNKTPAIQRQRSGAKGGRAARRSAKAKRQEYHSQADRTHYSGFDSPTSYSQTPSPLSTSRDQWSIYGGSPLTPNEEFFPPISYTLPHRSYCEFDPADGFKVEGMYQEEHVRQLLSAADQVVENVEQYMNQDQTDRADLS